jgi:HK97 family phage major capsid protein
MELIRRLLITLASLARPESNGSTRFLFFAEGPADDERLLNLRQDLLDLNEASQAIEAQARADKRDLSEDERKEIDRMLARATQIEDDIARLEKMNKLSNRLSQGQGRVSEQADPQNANRQEGDGLGAGNRGLSRGSGISTVADLPKGKGGFRSFGDFAISVKAASRQGGYVDPRLVMNAPTTYSSEGAGEDGGYAVPPDFRTEIWQKITGESSLLGRTDQNPTSKNTMVFPADETSPWDTTSGVQAYFESEAGQMSQSKINLVPKSIRLGKLTALIPVTEELLEDAPGLEGYLKKKVGIKFDFKINLKIIQGTGAGEPWGILKHGSLVSVTKESGQAADTIVAENIMNMWSRLYAPCRQNAVWLTNQDIEPQLWGMQLKVKDASGNVVGGTPIYMPPGGLSGSPYATIFNRPVIPTQACETLGDKGDIILVDLSQYLTATKSGGIRADVSMHLWFDYAVMAYRFILRIAGQPWWEKYITPRDGANYLSWAVTLDERA